MTWNKGGGEYLQGDDYTVHYNNSDNSVDPATEGMWVMLDGWNSGHPAVDTADGTNNTSLDAVLADEVAAGSLGKAQFNQVVWARVTSGVTAGNELATSSTAGVATSGGSSGHVALNDAAEKVSGSGNYFALVHLNAR